MSESKAAKAVGIAQSTLNGWKTSKPQLYKLVMDNCRKQVKK